MDIFLNKRISSKGVRDYIRMNTLGTHLPISEGWIAELTVCLWKVVLRPPTNNGTTPFSLDVDALTSKKKCLLLEEPSCKLSLNEPI